jgi:alpha-ketoglutarate-dependent taurine dioxygenase
MASLEIRNLDAEFGAEVLGLKPELPLDAQTRQKLREVFDERSLLVFRDLDIDMKYQTYLSEMLIGNHMPDPAAIPVLDICISNREERGVAPYGRLLFHSDMIWSEKKCKLLSLYGSEVAQPATPTLFASSARGWDTLPEDLRVRAEHRFAVHGHDDDTYYRRAQNDPDVLVSSFENLPFLKLPVAYTHPRTGQTLLYVTQQMTKEIADLDPQESEELLEALFAHLYRPEFIYAHHWRQGDLVAWDNIALQHARPNVQIEGPARTLRKVFAPAQLNSPIKVQEYRRAGV